MKLNFLNVLNGKVSYEEVAEQIVALEIKQKEYEKERDKSKAFCKEVRSRIMCGEKISPDIIKNADKSYEESILNLEIAAESIEELQKKLYEALQVHKEEEAKKLIDDRKKLNQDREKMMREFAKAKGNLFGMALSIYGHPELARRKLSDGLSFALGSSDPFFEEFESEKNKALEQAQKPTIAQVDRECENKDHWLDTFNLEERCAAVLKKYRDQYEVIPVEPQVVEA